MYNMQLALAMASASLALAAPSGEPSHITPRATVDMTLCLDANFQQCTSFNLVALGVCQNVPTNLNDRISSITHSQPHSCRFWQDAGCTGNFIGGNQDTYPNLVDQGFNDVITSWRCT
ncbi:hypothetical protein PG990_008139 [Apiospora arundinis]